MHITTATDPKTLMFEGHPDIQITGLAPRARVVSVTPGELYVYFNETSRAINADGTQARGNVIDLPGRVVPRAAFDPTKPLIATNDSGNTTRYELMETIIPADGSETRYRVRRADHQGHSDGLLISARTGRVISGPYGRALTFTNGPVIEKFGHVINIKGAVVSINITLTDGQPTAVELV